MVYRTLAQDQENVALLSFSSLIRILVDLIPHLLTCQDRALSKSYAQLANRGQISSKIRSDHAFPLARLSAKVAIMIPIVRMHLGLAEMRLYSAYLDKVWAQPTTIEAAKLQDIRRIAEENPL
jgi:hypothetical protein